MSTFNPLPSQQSAPGQRPTNSQFKQGPLTPGLNPQPTGMSPGCTDSFQSGGVNVGGPGMSGPGMQQQCSAQPGMGSMQQPYSAQPWMSMQQPYSAQPWMSMQQPYSTQPGMGSMQQPYSAQPEMGGMQKTYGPQPTMGMSGLYGMQQPYGYPGSSQSLEWVATLNDKRSLAGLAGAKATVLVDCSGSMQDNKHVAAIAVEQYCLAINTINADLAARFSLPAPRVAFVNGGQQPDFQDAGPGRENTVAAKVLEVKFAQNGSLFANALAAQINQCAAELLSPQGAPHRLIHALTPGEFTHDDVIVIERALEKYAGVAHAKQWKPAQHLGLTMIEISKPKHFFAKRVDKLHAIRDSSHAHDMVAVDCHVSNHESAGHMHDPHTRTANVLEKTAEHASGNHHHRTWLQKLEEVVESNIG